MNLFVYYKLIQSEHPNLPSRIKIMQAALNAQFPGLCCNLMKRPEIDVSGHETWMEIYTLINVDMLEFRKMLDQFALNANLPQPRKNEVFLTV
jgi:hypothetical protein